MTTQECVAKLRLTAQYLDRGIHQVNIAQKHQGLRYLHAARLGLREVIQEIEKDAANTTPSK